MSACLNWLRKLWKAAAKPIELFSAIAIAYFAYAQWHTTIKNNESNSEQTAKLIAAANINACAAKKSAQAARDFADTAEKINVGIGNAVDKLEEQARAIETSRKSSEAASRTALQTSIDSSRLEERPWVGCTGFAITPEIGPNGPTGLFFAKATLFNSGKTPAREVFAIAGRTFRKARSVFTKQDVDRIEKSIGDVESGDIPVSPNSNIFAQGNMKRMFTIPGPDDSHVSLEEISLGVLPPAIPHEFTLPENFAITGGDGQIIVFGRIRYIDLDGNTRKTSFCGYGSNIEGNQFTRCPFFNDMK
jgi:hypothetical protein